MNRKKILNEERRQERRNAVTGFLKSLIAPVCFLLVLAGVVFAVIRLQEAPVEEETIVPRAFDGEEKEYILENDDLKFTMDAKTTQFELLVKSNGKVWKSNPDGAADDGKALKEEKAKLQSPLVMSYNTQEGLETTYDAKTYSVDNGIYEIEEKDGGIEVRYSLGKVAKTFIIPPVCTETDFKKWTGAMSKEGLNIVQQYYKKYDINDLGKKDNKEELLASYPIMETEIIYILRSTTKDNVKKTMQRYFEEAGYTYDDLLADQELDQSQAVNENPVFNVTMRYRLDGDDLVVEIPLSELEYKKKYPMYTLTPLPYFGAGGKDDTGALFVPEGGGALIRFNNGRTAQSSYYANVYGWDMGISRKELVHNTRACFEVFGIEEEDGSFICVLEDGKSYAAIQADIAGKNHSFNYVNATYSICQREQYDIGDIANSDVYKYIDKLPDEDLVLRYSFVDSGSYVDMAKDYAAYLHERYGKYLALNTETSTPVSVEIVGAVDKVRQILGVPVSRPLKLTTYKEAEEMVRELTEAGMTNLSVKLSGWCNGGVQQKLLKKVRLIGALGSKKDLQSLANTANSLGVDLYLNGVTQYEYNSNLLDGFFSYRDAAKFISKERAEQFVFSAVTYAAREGFKSYYLLHTDLAQKMDDNLVNYARSIGAGVSFEDDGKDLSADYYKKKTYSREAVLKLQEARFQSFSDAGQKMMVNMGNDYAVPYCGMVTNMDLRGNDYTLLDECIPFYQLAVHGYVPYTGYPVNICGDDLQQVLLSAEYGAGLQFTLMKESTFALQKTLYTEYYGADYSAWKDRMLAIYERYNAELGHVYGEEMTDHANLSDTLSVTTYADGTKVYVNYDFADAAADGVTVPARDYLVIR